MYHRECGDELSSNDKRLKYKWEWCRVASQVSKEEIKKWTHFQTSKCNFNGWELQAILWGSGEGVRYESTIYYRGEHILSSRENEEEFFKTRLEAQIDAEKLLKNWITTEYKRIIKGN